MNDAQIFKAQVAAPGMSAMQMIIIAVVIIAIVVWFFKSRKKNKAPKRSAQKHIDRSSLSPIEQKSEANTKSKVEKLSADENFKSPETHYNEIPIKHTIPSNENRSELNENAQLKQNLLLNIESWSSLVAKGKHEEVIEKIILFTKTNNLRKFHRQTITLSSRYKNLINSYNRGILKSEDVFLETNKINDALINLLYSMEQECM